MSDTDSFIEEVTEEVRRDRLFALMRKYGWIAVLIIAGIVGGAAFNEWRKAREADQAQAAGDALAAALEGDDPAAALEALPAATGAQAVLQAMLRADALIAAEDPEAARALLEAAASDASAPRSLGDLARLKALMLADPGRDPAALDGALSALSAPGAPYRLLALEQQAAALLSAGKRDEAITLYTRLLSEAEITAALRQRVSEMLVTLGVDPEDDSQLALPVVQ